jgi:hypothetical protein
MRTKIPAIAVSFAALACGLQAHAAVVTFQFSGGPFSGSGAFTITPNVAPADPNPACGTPGNNPCRTDPPGAWAITGITGTFSDAADGIFNAKITGLVPINPADERDPVFDPLVPSSLSFIDYPGGALTYNNLFFPKGSPIDCDFPFYGTFVDVFGMAFTVAGGYTVDLWGDGNLFGPGATTYGVGVTDGRQALAYQFAGVSASATVPEPATWMFMLLGFGGLGGALRSARRRARLA